MDKKLEEIEYELEERISKIFHEFMTMVTKFEQLTDVAKQFLVIFHQEIEKFRRPKIQNMSDLVCKLIDANYTERMKVYLEAGSRNANESANNISNCKSIIQLNECQILMRIFEVLNFDSALKYQQKIRQSKIQSAGHAAMTHYLIVFCKEVHSCHLGLEDHLRKVEDLLREIECLTEDAISLMKATNQTTSSILEELFGDTHQILPLDEEETEPAHLQDKSLSLTIIMRILYGMLKLDYTMQEKIIRSLNLMSPSSELEGYCLMWDLRPYVDEKLMRLAWKHVQ